MHDRVRLLAEHDRWIGIGDRKTNEIESVRDWQPITTAPYGRDLELSVIERGEVFALVFPCRRTGQGWVHAERGAAVPVDPTHWRDWLG